MLAWHTDNSLSRTVLGSISGAEVRHISEFHPHNCPHIFYGILRGCSRAMHLLKDKGIDYYYIDNGYFDALYVDKKMVKDMGGKFRVVKNGMHEVYPYEGKLAESKNILVIPPSTYSANFYDTTPEDWIKNKLGRIRTKTCKGSLDEDLAWCDGVMSFNSMAVMKAVEMGKAVYDTHGVFRNNGFRSYDINDLRAYYEPKQFTLEELKEGKWKFT